MSGFPSGPLPSPTSVPVSLSLNLRQGAPLLSGSTVSSRLGISGTLQISGISCFTSGVVGTTANSGTLGVGTGVVEGSQAVLPLTMNDGSTAQLLFASQDAASSQLAVSILDVPSGTCAGHYSFFLSPLILLKK